MNPLQIGFISCIALILLLASSMPVAMVMGIVGAAGFALIASPAGALHLIPTDLYGTFSSYSLTVIPLFIFMGQVAFHAGISRKLFAAAHQWSGRIPGALAIATVGACTAFGAICGSGPATAATMAAVALPEMRRHGYDDALASGTVAAGGGIGMLIPPSVVFIVYGVLTQQSIGKLFIAGILPGLLVAALFCATIAIQCIRNPALAPKPPAATWRERFKSLVGVIDMLALFALVMGGMFAGWFTPTEGAAVGAAGSVVVAAIAGKCTWKMLWKSLHETIRTSCMVMAIIAGANIYGHFLAVTEIPSALATWLSSLQVPSFAVISLIMIFFFVAGCFVDSLALILLTVPIFYPVILKLGCDPIWFGAMIVLVTQMGVITPPVGVNVYVVSGMERDIPLQTIFRGATPFLIALVTAAILMMIFPSIVTCLPKMM